MAEFAKQQEVEVQKKREVRSGARGVGGRGRVRAGGPAGERCTR